MHFCQNYAPFFDLNFFITIKHSTAKQALALPCGALKISVAGDHMPIICILLLAIAADYYPPPFLHAVDSLFNPLPDDKFKTLPN